MAKGLASAVSGVSVGFGVVGGVKVWRQWGRSGLVIGENRRNRGSRSGLGWSEVSGGSGG